MSAQEPAHKKAPGRAGATEATGTEGTTERSSLSATTVEGQDLDCPWCGNPAKRLPAGQHHAEPFQLFESCWAGPQVDLLNCGLESRLRAGLLGSLLDDPLGLPEIEPSDALLSRLGDQRLLFIRASKRHPLISDEFTLLLLDRLESIEVEPWRHNPGRPIPRARMDFVVRLSFDGIGTREALLTRYRAELRALLAAALGKPAVRQSHWCSSDRLWLPGRRYSLALVILNHANGGGTVLTWPDLQPVADRGSDRG